MFGDKGCGSLGEYAPHALGAGVNAGVLLVGYCFVLK